MKSTTIGNSCQILKYIKAIIILKVSDSLKEDTNKNSVYITIKFVFQLSGKNKNNYSVSRAEIVEPIIQSEVSQKDKHQYSIMHIYGI